jgi:hypothetical protein
MNFHHFTRPAIFAFVLAMLGMLAGTAALTTRAQTGTHLFRVAPTGTNATSCGSASAPCRTIQQAVNLAGDGDTILVAAGTYTYDPSQDVCPPVPGSGTTAVVCYFNKDLTVLGGYTTVNWSWSDPVTNVTIIDGQSAYRGVRVGTTVTPPAKATGLRLEGLTIQNGRADATNSTDEATAFGGGLLSENTPIIVRDVIFRGNLAIGGESTDDPAWRGVGAGGGLAFNTDAYHPGTMGLLERITFQQNQARGANGSVRGGAAHGGGLFTYGTIVSARQLVFTQNTAVAGSTSTGSGRTSDGQSADALGGAGSFQQNCVIDMEGVTAWGNSAIGGNAPIGDGGGAFGGAFFVEGASLTMRQSDVRNNLAQGGDGVDNTSQASIGQGGAVASIGAWVGATPLNADIALDKTTFVGNTARSGNGVQYQGAAGGGAVALTYSKGSHSICNCIIADNLVDLGAGTHHVGAGGGGLWLQGINATVSHSTFSRNQLSTRAQTYGAQGLAIVLAPPASTEWPSTASLSYVIVSDHRSVITATNHPRGLAAIQAITGTTANMDRGMYAANTLDDNSSADAVGWRGTFNGLSTMISAASAGFVSPGAPNENYHILMSSPARDQATGSTAPDDIDSDQRALPDIGADEWVPFPLRAIPGNGTIRASWTPTVGFGAIIDHYSVVVNCPQGAAPPVQGGCGSAINAGGQTTLELTGLTNGATYGLMVTAHDANNAPVTASVQVASSPWQPADWIYMPLVGRAF